MSLVLATGPVCWGVDHADAPGNPPPDEVLAGIAAAGFGWTELGPLGYLDVTRLQAYGLGLTAGFVFEALQHGPRGELLERARATAAQVAGAGGRFLVVIDMVAPERARAAGRSDLARRLAERERDALLAAVESLAAIGRAAGLIPVVHPHAGTHIEFEDEIEPVLALADLCLDTGHLAYAGIDPVAFYRSHAERIPYVHVKDLDPARTGQGFWESVAAGAFRPLGAGSVDVPAFVAELVVGGYDGWLVVEQDRVPGSGDPAADLAAGRACLEAAIDAVMA